MNFKSILENSIVSIERYWRFGCVYIYTLEPHYNTHFGVHSDISVITAYNEGLIHRKYKQWEPGLWGVISK